MASVAVADHICMTVTINASGLQQGSYDFQCSSLFFIWEDSPKNMLPFYQWSLERWHIADPVLGPSLVAKIVILVTAVAEAF